MNKRILMMGVLGATALGWAGAASATDVKTHHASFCQSNYGRETDYNRSEYRITKVGGSGIGTLLCPVSHDVFSCSGWGGCVKHVGVKVRVLDNHNTGDVSCTLSARGSTGGAYWYSTRKTYNRPGTPQTLSLSGGARWGSADTYILKCSMPTNSRSGYAKIFSYRVEEND